MTQRKGEVDRAQLRRQWPHHVALSAEKVRGLKNSTATYGLAQSLSGGPRTYHLRRGDADFVVFCFAKPEDADTFCEQLLAEDLAVMSLSAEQRRALELLAGAPRGYTKGRLLADGFTVDMLADLV